MNEKATHARLGRPRDALKSAQIIEAAWELFLSHGVEAVSIEAIARRAGVSKGTLYASYPDKAALFAVCLQREMDRIELAQGVERVPEGQVLDATLSETLRAFGMGIMTFLATETAINFYGVLAGELRRSPSLAQSFWEIGPGKTKQNLVAIITEATNRGELDVDDFEGAAEVLIGAWQGFSNYQLALGLGAQHQVDAVTERVDRGIQFFLRAYGVALPVD